MAAEQVIIVISALLFVLMLLLALGWMAKRSNWLSKRNTLVDMQIIGNQSLGARCSVTAVKVADTCLVLGVTPQKITLLHSMSLADKSPHDFAKALDQVAKQ